jgi:hypothetical protein
VECGRWSSYQRGELRRLRRDVAQALTIARVALTIIENHDPRDDLAGDLTSMAQVRRQGQRARDEALRRNKKLRAAAPSDDAATVRDVTG